MCGGGTAPKYNSLAEFRVFNVLGRFDRAVVVRVVMNPQPLLGDVKGYDHVVLAFHRGALGCEQLQAEGSCRAIDTVLIEVDPWDGEAG